MDSEWRLLQWCMTVNSSVLTNVLGDVDNTGEYAMCRDQGYMGNFNTFLLILMWT